MILFTLASLLCAFSNTGLWFIISRALQGIGGALMIPNGNPILFAAYPAHERGKAYGWLVSISGIFMITGPVIGGLLTEYLSWRYIFLKINVPVAAVGSFIPFVPPPL